MRHSKGINMNINTCVILERTVITRVIITFHIYVTIIHLFLNTCLSIPLSDRMLLLTVTG
uniref:Uncharacterized protein n=1 Tax=Octopus bimaculoides TaxID=37653 RepID=A0A0L8HLE2_OCTBM